ncbi:MAG: penicillin-binding protein 2 [Patescibacteria group bacterium]
MIDEKKFTRIRFISIFFLFLSLVLLSRLFQKQILEGKDYIAKAKSQQQFSQIELAERGKVYFHDSGDDLDKSYAMAYDIKNFSLFAVPKNIKDKHLVASKLASFVGKSELEVFASLDNDKSYLPALKKGLSYEDADKIEALEFTGVYVLPEYKRYYPESDFSAQLLGFVDAEGNGKYGFEGFYDEELKGSSGKITGEKDTLGRVISLLSEDSPKDGASYLLSVDRSVNFYIYQTLRKAIQDYQAESGMAVVVDVKTGKIVGMASFPSFDPNNYTEYANNKQENLFKNPIISTAYEPGSIFKPLVVAAGLDSGKITPDSGSTFGASVDIQGFTIHTAEDKAFGAEKIGDILKHSDNVGMVWVGQQIGSPIMDEYIRKFGFADKTGIDLSGEGVGIIQPLKDWGQIGQATVSFGQGISVTPIQLVMAYAAIANKGVMMKPQVVDKIIKDNGTSSEVASAEVKRVLSEQTTKDLTAMLTGVVEEGYGKKAGVSGFWVAGKTGTAQIADPATGKYMEGVFNHSFAGFAPADDPKFAMLVELDKPKNARFAESSAAPVFGSIASYLLNYYYRIAPNR